MINGGFNDLKLQTGQTYIHISFEIFHEESVLLPGLFKFRFLAFLRRFLLDEKTSLFAMSRDSLSRNKTSAEFEDEATSEEITSKLMRQKAIVVKRQT